jgi:hypothetical protein
MFQVGYQVLSKCKTLFLSAFQLKNKKQKQTMKIKIGFWSAEKQAYEEMNKLLKSSPRAA